MTPYKSYSSVKSAKAAIRKAGLEQLNWETVPSGERIVPRFFVHLREDVDYLAHLGFMARVDSERAAE
jgi:hypothetical protein